ncbi:FprA family A-type flavoprotein [Chitinivibrio alkaliphilus]|uniref:Metallo-beta-lactamase/flavodoxin domain-containing protein n=1 Tax=Chitinivibrio alkaliphilus ACht1 TaxID=1313304 RepID=U7D9F0_9BACT|nr:FprA family A-type flavoprotein [Chitinivibrio alkaliphilus]ERP31717.1 metallo-beta-lactamase/flavodoxin domain-containing protein [Chitinivibrio alkaliphilus ACht1]
MFRANEVCENVYWVGVIDWNLRNFHGYLTQRGSTYNSYLILDEKITLIDNVKATLQDEFLERIASIIDPSKIDIVVQNHVEMDHSGSLPKLMEYCPNATIYAPKKGVAGLREHYQGTYSYVEVKEGDHLCIGSRNIHFIPTPMVHWPDNMVSYIPEDKILFSNDSLGQHIATAERFDDEVPSDIVMEEAAKYYANIVMPYSRQVKKELAAVEKLDISVVCPSHGVIWRSHISDIISNYHSWANNCTSQKALVVYDTMWGSTERMAQNIVQGFEELGIPAELCSVQHTHRSDIITKVLDAEYICVGSPTLNNNMLPTMAAFLTYLKGLSPKKRTAFAFGSYGWGGQSVSLVEEELKKCGFTLLESISTKYVPDDEDLREQREHLVTQMKQVLPQEEK